MSVITAAAGVFALAALTAAEAQENPILVEYLPEVAGPATSSSEPMRNALDELRNAPGVMALRVGRAIPVPVVRARALSIVLPESGVILSIDDLVVEVIERGYALHSRDRRSTTKIALVVTGEDVAGTLHHDGAAYGVSPLGGGFTAVYLMDTARLRTPPEWVRDFLVPDIAPEGSAFSPQSAREISDPGDEIDVLVAYTRSVGQSVVNVDARIALLFLHTNLIYQDSGITTRLRMVHSYETSYDAEGDRNWRNREVDLGRLQAPGDGQLDDVHEKRDQFGADVVMLLHLEAPPYCGGGIAYMLDHGRDSDSISEWAFGVCGIGRSESCSALASDGRTFAHEVGHIQGAAHNPEQVRRGEDPSPYSYGHGFCNDRTGWRTVMSYNTDELCETTIPHFSNPVVLYQRRPTGDAEIRNVARVINETAVSLANFRPRRGGRARHTHRLPFVPGADANGIRGFVLVRNRSEGDGEVELHAVDDTGRDFGPVTLEIAAGHTVAFNSRDLEFGNPAKGLHGGIGDGNGHWRLKLVTGLDIEARGYVRTGDGFVTSMHQLAREHESITGRYMVPFFNPASNTSIRSLLRVANPNPTEVYVRLEGWDFRGRPSRERVEFSLGAEAAVLISSQQLEAGDRSFTGRFGDGAGKWRLAVSTAASQPLEVMSLLSTATGHLTNMSR